MQWTCRGGIVAWQHNMIEVLKEQGAYSYQEHPVSTPAVHDFYKETMRIYNRYKWVNFQHKTARTLNKNIITRNH